MPWDSEGLGHDFKQLSDSHDGPTGDFPKLLYTISLCFVT